MASTSNALVLGDGGVKIWHAQRDLDKTYGTFTQGHVDNQTSPNSFYMVYDKADYGKSEGSTTQAKMVPADPLNDQGRSGNVQFGFTAKSTQGFDLAEPGIILFEHPKYIGNSAQYFESHESLDIPARYWDGVSSFIITGGKWELYTKENFHQPKVVLNSKTTLGPGYYDDNTAFDDKIKSIRLVEI